MKLNINFVSVLFFAFSTAFAADLCPPLQSEVDPKLTSNVEYDRKSKLYRYRYSIINGQNASIALDKFGFYVTDEPINIDGPDFWRHRFIGNDVTPSYFYWGTSAIKASEAQLPADDGVLPEHIYALKPGGSLSGFSFHSARPPGIVQYFGKGQTQVPTTTATPENSEPVPKCEGWSFTNPQIQTQVTGATVGPSDPEIKSIRIRARSDNGISKAPAIDSKKPKGRISVLVFDTSDFDASAVDLANIVFGPGYARPVSSKLVPNGHGEKLTEDERGEWEKLREKFKYEGDTKSKSRQNLLLVFEVKDLDVQCHLDRDLFLRGKTKTGEQFIGSVPARIAGCKKGQIGVHKANPFPFRWWEKKDAKKETGKKD